MKKILVLLDFPQKFPIFSFSPAYFNTVLFQILGPILFSMALYSAVSQNLRFLVCLGFIQISFPYKATRPNSTRMFNNLFLMMILPNCSSASPLSSPVLFCIPFTSFILFYICSFFFISAFSRVKPVSVSFSNNNPLGIHSLFSLPASLSKALPYNTRPLQLWFSTFEQIF